MDHKLESMDGWMDGWIDGRTNAHRRMNRSLDGRPMDWLMDREGSRTSQMHIQPVNESQWRGGEQLFHGSRRKTSAGVPVALSLSLSLSLIHSLSLSLWNHEGYPTVTENTGALRSVA